jgi:RHH-type transcriptional regulator, rel operon repressor / antitoxin RelB
MLYMYSISHQAATMLALRLPPEIEARLAELAKRTGRTKSFYAREAILSYIDDLEDIYLAEGRLKDLRECRSGSIPLNELLRRHGVED